MTNKEQRIVVDSVHIYMALARNKFSGVANCIRTVIKDEQLDLAILEEKLIIMSGVWRIHKTVNARDVQKARVELVHRLIDYPKKASYIDSEWRTYLLQSNCIYGQKRFMLDVDTKDKDKIHELDNLILNKVDFIGERWESPNGWHYIVKPFDTREVCELGYVTLIRDGYYYIKTVGE